MFVLSVTSIINISELMYLLCCEVFLSVTSLVAIEQLLVTMMQALLKHWQYSC